MEGTGASSRRHMRLRGKGNAWKESLILPKTHEASRQGEKGGIAEEEKKC